MNSVIGFLLAIFILVGVHEFGHYMVARWFGVRVFRFAIGFGKVLLSRTDARGTEFCLCAIPLGGYVRMLDSRETGKIEEEDRPYAFDHKPIWQRILIVFAGPFINLLLAVLLLALVNFGEVQQTKPYLVSYPTTLAYINRECALMMKLLALRVNPSTVGVN